MGSACQKLEGASSNCSQQIVGIMPSHPAVRVRNDEAVTMVSGLHSPSTLPNAQPLRPSRRLTSAALGGVTVDASSAILPLLVVSEHQIGGAPPRRECEVKSASGSCFGSIGHNPEGGSGALSPSFMLKTSGRAMESVNISFNTTSDVLASSLQNLHNPPMPQPAVAVGTCESEASPVLRSESAEDMQTRPALSITDFASSPMLLLSGLHRSSITSPPCCSSSSPLERASSDRATAMVIDGGCDASALHSSSSRQQQTRAPVVTQSAERRESVSSSRRCPRRIPVPSAAAFRSVETASLLPQQTSRRPPITSPPSNPDEATFQPLGGCFGDHQEIPYRKASLSVDDDAYPLMQMRHAAIMDAFALPLDDAIPTVAASDGDTSTIDSGVHPSQAKTLR